AARVKADRLTALKTLLEDFPYAIILLKGVGTLVGFEGRIYLLPFGSVAMATAGQGDLLAGVIGSYLGQGLEPLKATLLGSAVCGKAGEDLSREKEPQGVLAHE